MILSDKTIKQLVEKEGLITPFSEANLSPASYDLTIADSDSELVLKPGEAKLIATKETLNLPAFIAAKTVSKSSFARCGITIGDIGGWIDPGYRGQLTLLAVNLGDSTFRLNKIKEICQIVFMQIDNEAMHSYNGHYQDSEGIQGAWFDTGTTVTEDYRNIEVLTNIQLLN